jgi:hypothetical protein
MVMGYSRALFVPFTTTQRLETFLACHLRAFEAFGGYPRERLYDHTKTVVLARPDLRADAAGHAPHWHPTGLDFAGYAGFTPRLCRPYRARTTGQVARLIRYVRERCFAGCRLTALADLHRQMALGCATVANARVHATTGEVPAIRLHREPLLPLTARPLDDTSVVVPRRVSSACLVAYEGHHDSVPFAYGGRRVWLRVRAEQSTLEIGAEDICLGVHPLLPGHSRQSVDPDPLKGVWNLTRQSKGPGVAPAPVTPGDTPGPCSRWGTFQPCSRSRCAR